MGRPDASHKAGMTVLKAIRKVKDHARNRIYRALHHAESSLAAALGMVSFPKRSKKRQRKGKKPSAPKVS